MKRITLFSGLCMLIATSLCAQDYHNLILNPAAQNSNLNNWQIVTSGGDGWTVHENGGIDNTPCFGTSWDWSVKSQTIDLVAQGYSTALLDKSPLVLFSERYRGEGNGSTFSDLYYLNIELRDADGEVITEFNSGIMTCDDQWQTLNGSFRNYGPGLRSIYYEHAGKGVSGWAGFYGAKIDDSYLSIVNHVIYCDAETQSLSGWVVTENGGDGWLVDGFYRTSYEFATKHQLIDLVGLGYPPADLDDAPYIYAGEWSVGFWPDYADLYKLNIQLLDENMNVIQEYVLNTTTTSNWEWHGAEFEDYGPGLRFIYFEHSGCDIEYWLGHYGTGIDNCLVDIVLNTATGSGETSENTATRVSVFPNPAIDHFTIKLVQRDPALVSISITDVEGITVYSENMGHLTDGVHYKHLFLESLTPGIYLIYVHHGQEVQTARLVIQ